MPLYTMDLETRNMITYSLSVYKFRDYLGGFLDLSAYLAGLTFERVILQTGTKLNLASALRIGGEPTVTEVIDFLRERRQVNEQEYERLKRCRDFRNKLMHEGPRDVPVEETTKWVLRMLCNMAGMDFENELARREFEDILRFGERAVTPKQYTRIEEGDFDDFITLYEKCLSLQQELKEDLASLSLLPEEVSEFVPTSGGIWLPWVLRQADGRSHMKRITLGMTFKPDIIRIGLDFGSKAYDAKKRYYQLLMEGKLDPILSPVSRDYAFYETYWYYHIRNVKPVEDHLKQMRSQSFRKRVEEAYRETGNRLLRGQPMTGHKYLVGKLIERTTPAFSSVLSSLKQNVYKTFTELVPILEMVESD